MKDSEFGEVMIAGTLGTAFVAVFATVFMLVLATIRGFCVWCMYGWFVVPLGAPAIGLWQTIGILILWGSLSSHMSPDYVKEDGERIKSDIPVSRLATSVFGSLMCLLVAWIIHGWM